MTTTGYARGLVIAAPRSGSGKTTVTLGLLRALARAGYRVAGAKCGPDYIDPAFHMRATGRPSFNLDTWAMDPATLMGLASTGGRDADLVLCEGLMGLFDGVPAAPGRSGATADVAATLGWPVLLIHDVSGQAQSAAAQIVGCARFDPRIEIAGVILNRVGSERHRRLVSDALARFGIPVLGSLPRTDSLALPERHLGLVQAGETADLDGRLDALGDFIASHIDLAAVAALARPSSSAIPSSSVPLPPPGQRIAIAQDVAFSFLYPHLLEGWRRSGAGLSFFSPLNDEPPPDDCDCVWLPGGYPELHGAALAAATRFRSGLRAVAQSRPVHGECGGYMVLGEALIDRDGVSREMTGLLSLVTSFATRKLHLGYRAATLLEDSSLGRRHTQLRGHEFHYATVVASGDPPFASVSEAHGAPAAPAGSRRGQVTGTFFHAIARTEAHDTPS